MGTCTCFLLLCGVCNGRRDNWILFLSSVSDSGDGILKNNDEKKKKNKGKKKCPNFVFPAGTPRDAPPLQPQRRRRLPVCRHHGHALGSLEHLLPVGLVLDVLTPVADRLCRLNGGKKKSKHLSLPLVVGCGVAHISPSPSLSVNGAFINNIHE